MPASSSRPRHPWWLRALRAPALALVAVVLALEQWGWRPLVAAATRLAQWPPIARLEAALQRLPPRVAVAVFLAPSLLLIPVKLLALWLIHLGHAILGLLVILAAKLLGTALVGRLFVVTEAQLLKLPWFARVLGWWRATQQQVREALRRWAPWRAARCRIRWLRRSWRRA